MTFLGEVTSCRFMDRPVAELAQQLPLQRVLESWRMPTGPKGQFRFDLELLVSAFFAFSALVSLLCHRPTVGATVDAKTTRPAGVCACRGKPASLDWRQSGAISTRARLV